MKADLKCYFCCVKKIEFLLSQYNLSDNDKIDISKKIFYFISKADNNITAPLLMGKCIEILQSYVNDKDIYQEIKLKYNDILLKKEHPILESIYHSDDKFIAALKYAITGNYIDFGAMDNVEEQKLNELLENAQLLDISNNEIENLRKNIENAKNLVYITDNCGEIVLDKIFIDVLKNLYKSLDITVIVRGKPILNDATMEDAKYVGLTDIVKVVDNQTAIPGTELNIIGKEAKDAILNADLCIAKGQGNFETLNGCGLNIYYMFLCKCDLFTKNFNVEQYCPILKNEKTFV